MKAYILLFKIIGIVLLLNACSSQRQLSDLSTNSGIFTQNNRPYTGLAVEYYPDKSKKAEYNIIWGEKKGDFKIWYPNGQVRAIGNIYQHLKTTNQYLLHRSLRIFDENGNQILERNYNRGQVVPFFNPLRSPHSGKIWMDRSHGSPNFTVDSKGYFSLTPIYFGIEAVDSKVGIIDSYTWGKHSTNEKWNLLSNNKVLPLNITESSSICPPGYRLPIQGEFEEELKGMKSDTKFDLNLIPQGKWDNERNIVVDEGAGYFWIKSDMGYEIARISESSIEYGLPDEQYYYSVRCLFTPSQFPGLRRSVIKYGNTKILASQYPQLSGTLTIYLCIDRSGRIIFREINQAETTIRNPEAQKSALEVMNQFLFAADEFAPEVECGDYFIRLR